jgi:hypothetical protein
MGQDAMSSTAATSPAPAGRPGPPSRPAMQVWCGLADCPHGTADDVAEFLAPYANAGCAEFNLTPQSPDPDQAIAGVAAVKKLLAQ